MISEVFYPLDKHSFTDKVDWYRAHPKKKLDKKVLRENQMPEIGDVEYRRTQLLLRLELIGIGVILLAAPLMARGIGMN